MPLLMPLKRARLAVTVHGYAINITMQGITKDGLDGTGKELPAALAGNASLI
jgi:hypothetical protein